MTREQLAESVEFSAMLTGDDFIGPDGKLNLSGQSHWMICIKRNGRTYTTDFHQGAAHRVYRKRYDTTDTIGKATSRKVKLPWSGRMTLHEESELKASVPIAPNVLDVLYCLAGDAQSVECSTFEDWCSEFGYDTDSRKAEKAYRACCDTRAALAGMFDLNQLYQLFQDY